jgi:hypothetical protein
MMNNKKALQSLRGFHFLITITNLQTIDQIYFLQL